MLRKIKNCPLVAITKRNSLVLFEHDVIVQYGMVLELTPQTIAELSRILYRMGIDIVSVTIDETRMNYKWIEVL